MCCCHMLCRLHNHLLMSFYQDENLSEEEDTKGQQLVSQDQNKEAEQILADFEDYSKQLTSEEEISSTEYTDDSKNDQRKMLDPVVKKGLAVNKETLQKLVKTNSLF